MRPASDYQLPVAAARDAADQRIGRKYVDSLDDLIQPVGNMRRLVLFEVLEDPFKVLADRGSEFDARQRYLANLRALGRRTALPAERPSR